MNQPIWLYPWGYYGTYPVVYPRNIYQNMYRFFSVYNSIQPVPLSKLQAQLPMRYVHRDAWKLSGGQTSAGIPAASIMTAEQKAELKPDVLPKRFQSQGPKSKAVPDAGRRPEDFTENSISQADIDVLESMYGIDLENVYGLSAGQKWMLEQNERVESAFFLQVMIKAGINIDPPAFRRRVDEVSEKRDSLRSAFVTKGLTQPVRVVLKNRRVELQFRDLSDISQEEREELLEQYAEADRRRGFDLAQDALLRISCYKQDTDSWVFLISQPHINSDGTSLMLLLKDIFLPFAFEGAELLFGSNQKELSDKEYGQWLRERDTATELGYWQESLKDLPAFEPLPGREPMDLVYSKSTYTLNFGEELTAKLKALQRSCRVTTSILMQSAWAALLMGIRGSEDITYGLVTNGREAEMAESLRLTGGFINVIPMRVQACGNRTLGDLIGQVTGLQSQALKNSHCSIREIQMALGRQEPIFDHLLNFQQFGGGAAKGGAAKGSPGLNLMDIRTYDNLSEDLCIYFVDRDKEMVCNFAYNASAITEDAIRMLAEGYRDVLSQFAGSAPEGQITALNCPLMRDFDRLEMLRGAALLRTVSDMRHIRAFANLEDLVLWDLLSSCKVVYYRENDTILFPGRKPESVLILLSGMVEYNGVNQQGWTVPLRNIREGSMISASSLWKSSMEERGKKRPERGARVISEKASVLLVPVDTFLRLISQYPETVTNILHELDDWKTAMETLWMTS